MDWYSLDTQLNTEIHPPVDFDRAVEIVDEYFARGGQVFGSSEEAMSATVFGFSRSASVFIEFCIHGPAEIAYKFEFADPTASWLSKVFKGSYRFESVLRSKSEMLERVNEFFTCPPAEIKAKLLRKQ